MGVQFQPREAHEVVDGVVVHVGEDGAVGEHDVVHADVEQPVEDDVVRHVVL